LDENIAALWVWLNSSKNQMTYEPMHSAEAQSVKVKEKICFAFVVGYATFQSGRFGLSRFGHGTFRSWSFRSRDISVRLWNLGEILYVHFLMQTYLNQRIVVFKKNTNMIQDPTVNQHEHKIFVIISKHIKSLSTFSNTITSNS